MVNWIVKAVPEHVACLRRRGRLLQRDARAHVFRSQAGAVLSTDPPYYDNISLRRILSDFFYVWLRRNLSDVWPRGVLNPADAQEARGVGRKPLPAWLEEKRRRTTSNQAWPSSWLRSPSTSQRMLPQRSTTHTRRPRPKRVRSAQLVGTRSCRLSSTPACR